MSAFKLWVDDVRPAPDESWTHAFNSEEARAFFLLFQEGLALDATLGVDPEDGPTTLEEVSLDGDLGIIDGVEDSGEFVLDYMIKYAVWPSILTIHTSNRAKRDRMVAAAKSIGADAPEGIVIRVKYW